MRDMNIHNSLHESQILEGEKVFLAGEAVLYSVAEVRIEKIEKNYLKNFSKTVDFLKKVRYINSRLKEADCFAGVSEWQTRQTQNLLCSRTCGFKSRRRHSLAGASA